MKLFEIRKRE